MGSVLGFLSFNRQSNFSPRTTGIRCLFLSLISLFFLFFSLNCKASEDTSQAILSVLSQLFSAHPNSNPFSVGQTINLNGNAGPQALGTVVDPSNAGTAVGIALQGSGIPVLIILYNSAGNPYAVDVNGDGNPDYFLCTTQGVVTLRTGGACTGNQVIVFPGQGYDTNGDGVPDNLILSSVASDVVSPSSVISPNPGIYGGSRTVTVVCSDNIAPGNIIYTLDGTVPNFIPLIGKVMDPAATSFTIGSAGDGTYTVKYFCRDLAGNSESTIHTAVYQVNHNIPNVTITSALSSSSISINVGTLNSASLSWQSNQTGTYSLRQNATGCSDGTVISSGSVTANTPITSSILANQLTVGLNSMYLCVTAGLTGFLSFNISRDDTPPSINLNPGAGTFGTSPQNISFACVDSSSCTIVYTTDGSTPFIDPITGVVGNGLAYSNSPVSLTSGTTTLKYLARDAAGNLSSVGTSTYTINSAVATITANSYSPSSKSINASVSSTMTITWQSDLAGTYQILIGTSNCTSGGTLATGTNVGGNATAGTPIVSVLNNSNFSNGNNSVLICVANASLAPQYGSLSTTIVKDGILPTIQSSTPSNNSLGVASSSSRISIVFSESMNTNASQLPSSYLNACPASQSGTVYFEADIYDGTSLNCADVTANFTWLNSGTTLQIDLSWISFPENTKIQVTIPASSLTDVAGNALATAAQITFTTAPSPNKFGILTTGQGACWDVNGNPVPCSSTGQDGALQTGTARSYQVTTTANTSITTDSSTGLIWKTCQMDWEIHTGACTKSATPIGPWTYSVDTSGTPTKYSALNACASLNSSSYAGINTWRLPTLAELATILKYGSGVSPALDTSAFTNPTSGQASNYWVNLWTGTGNFSNPYFSWIVNLSDGSISPVTKPNSNAIMCVSAQNSNATSHTFSVNSGGGFVTDNGTGLIWELCTAGLSGSNCSSGTATTYTWQNALNRCNALTTAGKTWRLPNVNELRSIADYSKSNPSIDSITFPATVSSYYWTSTSYAQSPSNAWYVYFNNGQMNPFTSKGSTYYVRCVTN
ncbi:PF07603 family protein [Leptospira fainei serovar Hurstbridge str. BUT 6]|uniref:PF07603 family protein n=1 Tax=Leptospira fainei serovar Hurstbridge str. BUT 6 TaxID=1193011 RepID=S3URR6_9LEPT|nr:PF07603 family protein [Leptospira fainei serovar Hurstbridge str. BUT 6]